MEDVLFSSSGHLVAHTQISSTMTVQITALAPGYPHTRNCLGNDGPNYDPCTRELIAQIQSTTSLLAHNDVASY